MTRTNREQRRQSYNGIVSFASITIMVITIGSLCQSTQGFVTPALNGGGAVVSSWKRKNTKERICNNNNGHGRPSLLSCASLIDPSLIDPSLIDATTTTVASGTGDVTEMLVRAFQSEERPFQYWFMLPTATMVAICCQLAGIGGAAALSPIFLLVFPLLGPDYPLQIPGAAIASALLTEVFGFASGLSGYARRGLVDWRVSAQFLIISVPSSLAGALAVTQIAANPTLLRGVYAALMLGLALYLVITPKPETLLEECDISELTDDDNIDDPSNGLQTIKATDGTEYTYLPTKLKNDIQGIGATVAGSALTGLLGVGAGEVVLPQLVRGSCMPLPVAAGTSVSIVVVTALTAAVVQFLALADQLSSGSIGGDASLVSSLVQVIPWSLVQFTVPGAILGGQIAPFLASRNVFSDDDIERFVVVLFGIIGTAFAVKTVTG